MVAKNQVTINQVALEAGVSAQTVSRVLNDRPDVSAQTRLRVKEVIKRLGYRPNTLARSLIRQRSQTIGVVAGAWTYFGPMQYLIGIEKQIRAFGYNLLLDMLHHPEIENVEQILNRLLSAQVDGIIWAIPEIGSNRSWLSRETPHLPVPSIFISMKARDGITDISIDNYMGGCQAVEHLIDQGYRQIGIITGPMDWWESRQRKRGWQETLSSKGLPAGDIQVVEGDWSAESGARGFKSLLNQFPAIDSVFACNDQMALGVFQEAHAEGRKIPEQLGMVGFDNIPESAFFWPALTTIEQPLLELGVTAVKELAKMIEGDEIDDSNRETNHILLSTRLITRDSSSRLYAASNGKETAVHVNK
jgi:LacI family transcriptional regulator